jgi:long-subunit acyl-CoA synthetase (AMP-forming)
MKLIIIEICWILRFASPKVVLVDNEYKGLVQAYKCKRIIVDDDVDGKSGEYEDIVRRGQEIEVSRGGKGWDDLVIDDVEEIDTMVLNCTSGTTSNPKV